MPILPTINSLRIAAAGRNRLRPPAAIRFVMKNLLAKIQFLRSSLLQSNDQWPIINLFLSSLAIDNIGDFPNRELIGSLEDLQKDIRSPYLADAIYELEKQYATKNKTLRFD